MKGVKLMNKRRKIRRGDIYYADLTPVKGSEQGGVRPVLVIQNDTGNRYSPTLVVAVVTSKEKPKLPTHVKINDSSVLAQQSIVLLEQIRTIDKCRLKEYVASLGNTTMNQINAALGISVGLENTDYEEISA